MNGVWGKEENNWTAQGASSAFLPAPTLKQDASAVGVLQPGFQGKVRKEEGKDALRLPRNWEGLGAGGEEDDRG